ncbi:hypothetical protein OXX80_003325 [Metschnikowia pulcherrima]
MIEHSLLEYLCTQWPGLEKHALLQTSELDADCASFRAFLTKTRIKVRNDTESVQIPVLPPQTLAVTHAEFIDEIAKTGLGPNISFQASSGENVGLTDFKTSLLKSLLWERLCVFIGRQQFVALLCQVSCFLRPEGNITIGSAAFQKKVVKKVESVRKFHMYFSQSPYRRVNCLLQRDPEKVVRFIFRLDERQRHVSKKYRQLLNLLKVAKRNDNKLRYDHILNTVNPRRELREAIFENAVPFHEVTRFVFVVIHRLFPRETFGCQENWNLINDNVYAMLKSERTETVNVRNITQSLIMTAIPWLGKSARPTSKQDFALRMHTLYQFVHWFFAYFLVRLISLFYYVTDNPVKTKPSESSNAYFLHSSWNKMSRAWLREYVSKYLNVESDPGENETNFNRGTLRLIPKKSDFRPLCVPSKFTSCDQNDIATKAVQKKQHAIHDFTVMRPIRDILRYQQQRLAQTRGCPFPRCNSVNDVGREIKIFKAALLTRFAGNIPPLFAVQFDMKHCYDNLNQAKILSCIEELFSNDLNSEEYMTRRFTRSTRGNTISAPKTLVKSSSAVEELDIFSHNVNPSKHNAVYGDRVRTFKFQRGQILDLVRSQVLDATTELPRLEGLAFKRTRGVFQGFPLSGTLCDIVYDSLVDNVLARVKGKDHECILLRLADDFLFLSTSKDACQEMLKCARSREAKEFGAHVNSEKIAWMDATHEGNEYAHFLGLTIDLRCVSVERSEPGSVALTTNNKRSLHSSLTYLNWRFRLRLADYLLDLTLSGIKTRKSK